jgi:hypothetical protein
LLDCRQFVDGAGRKQLAAVESVGAAEASVQASALGFEPEEGDLAQSGILQ